MGASGSSNNTQPSTLISKNEQEADTSSYLKNIYFKNDDRRRRKQIETRVYTEENESSSQGPSPDTTLRGDESRNPMPTVLSLSNTLPPSKRETLLTYAAQMTGWQSADGHGPSMYQQNNEVMELSRIISQLAMTNHQLASAHNTTLTRMEALYLELPKNCEDNRNRTISMGTYDDVLSKRLRDTAGVDSSVEGEETRERLEQRVVRLENLVTMSSVQQSKQRGSRADNRLRSRIERLESLLKIRDTGDDESSRFKESSFEFSEQQTGRVAINTIVDEISENNEDQDATKKETDIRRCYSACSDDIEINVFRGDENKRSTDVKLNRRHRRRARLKDDEENTADRFECQSANERLLSNLTDQKNLMQKLKEDHEELKRRYVIVEDNLYERRQKCDELTKHLDSSKEEIERLLKEIDIFQSEKETTDERISFLEENLQKSSLEKQQIMSAQSQKISKLQVQLSEEISDKRKQIEALENAWREIQRLKESIKIERRKEKDVTSKQDIDIIDFTEDVSGNSSDHATSVNMEEFKKELTLKRETRQRAVATVSSEMERLRRELEAEKEAHSKTASMLAFLRSAHSNSPSLDLANNDFAKLTIREEGEREQQRKEDEKTLKRTEAQRLTNTLRVSDELRNDIRYQIEKLNDLRYHLEIDPERHRHRIRCLTEVTDKAREALRAQERQTNELKDYLAQILVRLGDRSFLEIRDDAQAECNRQLENINALKNLNNERLRVVTELRDSAMKELTDVKQKLEYSLKKSENLEDELRKAEEKVDTQASEMINLESQLGLTKADCRDLQNQMSLINGLFTQMLLGASSADMDLDRLTQLLQENHDLISDIAREESTEAAALPKLLLDLVEQVEGGKTSQRHMTNNDNNVKNDGDIKKEDDKTTQEEDIAHNLPKVWRVLLELLSCHAVTSPSVSVASCSDPNSCYKSVDTPAGPTLVISVSKTYIRLKELILEKKHLEKEMNRMKQLNTHLESKLGEQEKRLSTVSAELTKTWNIVGRMQAQHQQLHTHEEILRYELQQKRKMLQELKQELEYCREKWESARQKNTNTELEWRNLRREFAARKALAVHDSFNSAESGFSDERGDDSDEEEEAIEGRIRHGPRRKTRKESFKAPSPDTEESEQPTDIELSESKTGSSVALEQRTSTPETEAELDETEVANINSEFVNISDNTSEHIEKNKPESPNLLDQALVNVIQNLIRIDEKESNENIFQDVTSLKDSIDNPRFESNDTTNNNNATISKTDFCSQNPRLWTQIIEPLCSLSTPKTLNRTVASIDLPLAMDNNKSTKLSPTKDESSCRQHDDGETTKSKSISSSSVSCNVSSATDTDTRNMKSVFFIGPVPTSTTPLSSMKNAQFNNSLITRSFDQFSTPVFGATAIKSENFPDNFIAVVRSSLTLPTHGEEGKLEDKEQRSSKQIESVVDSDSISVDSSSSMDTVREFSTSDSSLTSSIVSQSKEKQREIAVNSQKETTITSTKSRTSEEMLKARADRLKRLEEQTDWLVKKMNATSKRGSALCTRLEELHDVYGEPPVPPPMPDVLPSHRLPTSLLDLSHQVSESLSLEDTENTEDKSSDVQ